MSATSSATVHIIGAGLAGLSAAVQLAGGGRRVVVHESAGHAGGRCRSMHDDELGCTIDNGNHLLLSGNRSAMAYLDRIGARDTLISPEEPAFPFVDLRSGERWTLRPNAGRLPWWILAPGRRVPGTRPGDYLAALRLARAGGATIAECLDSSSTLYRRFWEPFAVSILNTAADEASARLLWPVIVEIFGRGGSAARPCIARHGLSASLVDPALTYLRAGGVEVRFHSRLRAFETDGERIAALNFGSRGEALGEDDRVVLAVPPGVATTLLPGLEAPVESRPIVNAHYRLEAPPEIGGVPFLGMVGGNAHWLFVRGTVVSVTVSAADRLVDEPSDKIAEMLWRDAAQAIRRPAGPLPPCRVVKEKRATFAQTPAEAARRPGPKSGPKNLFLAGDWTDTGLPATIEGAIRSGARAARLVKIS